MSSLLNHFKPENDLERSENRSFERSSFRLYLPPFHDFQRPAGFPHARQQIHRQTFLKKCAKHEKETHNVKVKITKCFVGWIGKGSLQGRCQCFHVRQHTLPSDHEMKGLFRQGLWSEPWLLLGLLDVVIVIIIVSVLVLVVFMRVIVITTVLLIIIIIITIKPSLSLVLLWLLQLLLSISPSLF